MKEKTAPYIPTDADIQLFLRSIEGKPIEVPVLLAAAGGLRRGEISAITQEDVTDLGVHINKAMVLSPDHHWVIKSPKTAAGYRFCPLPPQIIEKLRASLPLPVPNTITDQFIKALKRCGLPHFTFHKLRHYYASTLHALGVPDKYIMQNGGWESEEVLKNVYQHVLSDRAAAENRKVINFFGELYDKKDAR